jgi:uncharacterized protein (TIGR02231 family)
MRITSTLERVTLFPQGAEVVRVADIDLEEGEHRLILDDLPAEAVQSSLRVEGRADAPLEIGDVDSDTAFVAIADRPGEAERRRLEAEIEALEDETRALDGRRASLETQKTLMDNLAQSPVHPSPDQMTEIDWAARFELIGARLQQVHEALNRLLGERRQLDRKLAEARKRLRDLPAEHERRLFVSIGVRAAKALKGRLEVRYQVRDASWQPLYDARLDTGDGAEAGAAALELVSRARVQQSSGEDWRNVALSLSTSRPLGATTAPELHSEYLDIEPPAIPVGAPAMARTRAMKMAAPEAALDMVLAAAPAAEAFYVEAEEREGTMDVVGFQALFEVPGRVDVPGGGAAKKLRLGTARLPAKLEVRATPLIDVTAYLAAGFTPEGAAALLPGHVSLYRDGVYVGDGALPLVNAGETHELGFGALDQVQVRRIEVASSKGRHGLIKSENTDERHYRIKVVNRHKRPLPVRILERLPVPRHDKIRVETLPDTSPFSTENVDDRRGVVAFRKEVAAGGETVFELHYRISWPKDERIVHG